MNDHTGYDPQWPDDETARRLRDVLGHEARSIQPSPDGLAQIRDRIRARGRSPRAWLRPLAVAGAAAATAAVVIVAVVLVPHGGTGHISRPAASGSTSNSSPSPSTAPSSATPPITKPHDVYIYYVGAKADPQQLLYREKVTRQQPADNAFIHDAVDALLTTQPSDSDYLNPWPKGTTILGATIKNDTEAIIDLSTEAKNGPHALGAIAAQELVYTIEGAAPKIESVELRIAGTPVTSLWGSQIADPVTAQPAWQVFAHVWITSPLDGATVPANVSFGGEAIVNEATVSWQILMNGDVLKKGFTNADAGAPEQGTWHDSVTLTPGTYELRAFETSMKDGSQTYVDSKTFTVQ